MKVDWSREFPFERNSLQDVPEEPGLYQILQSSEYPRYRGNTRILKIGASKSNLRSEIDNHFIRHTAANRLARIKRQKDLYITFVYAQKASEEAIELEKQLLREFEDTYWELPVLNSTRGYARGEDNHYKEIAT
jgi:excinuclease UvrABC nuclease subunit